VDRLRLWLALLVLLALTACGGGARPRRLLNGDAAATLAPVRGSVVAATRVLPGAALEARADACAADIAADARVVERVGVDSESLTFASPDGAGVYACDGGLDPAGERSPPWCGLVFGERVAGRLLDPRLDVNCRDRGGHALAYAFVEPVAGAHWIGVTRDDYVELYEVLADLPVRIATTAGARVKEARARFEIEEYDAAGRLLTQEVLEAAVAG